MDIQAIVSLDRTECAVQCNSKKRILEIIADIAAKQNENIDQATVLNSLMARERMGSTGIGNGIALPHGRLAGLEKVIAIVVTSTPAIDFDALDEKPVDIFFALLVPEEQTEGHLQTLATVAGKLSDKETIKAIRRATTSDEILSALS
ncbi:nitrogen regulatory IIA protein [Alteromonas macleodii str. 'Black Sea 11']|jgi:PTS system nitrogen regulatory IIA component|uniref:PTS IIA-like nitrogen regulatory protein PtsN n=1 Tax=Alteromonas abrolhosensis TaxID=1892904 RepID=UPI000286F27D|nr:PTS IIA-like nitrogen regulatory protein PtsN [Alteromonas abrolhosensis]AFT77306.1 nitrogen regulatory IIA protein [Alteromonas macleodii str. 'Black Sea 11']NKW88635.1 PTS IIA-like nitrogen regulatory protein PtsN [Alteromonadaceae bacterium A_SAG4]NKX05065.1 PTS IIA-like nitrogen regulatory protein PtsN [Alteromonadaceae bacterium A_SAG6]NKX18130.1 PTS IIA-like nitrogen regulatory protein PtsN [Alteromonadaceae bacterium A_SAG5]NKX35147.1 PTS IIA-like nitrogen regulatory protein PtsN [Al|tara:strand:- start:1270 stop:1713 length:444 start_codon:yes stop_codon:yes gene_type:complete